jgi:hypothetical protein
MKFSIDDEGRTTKVMLFRSSDFRSFHCYACCRIEQHLDTVDLDTKPRYLICRFNGIDVQDLPRSAYILPSLQMGFRELVCVVFVSRCPRK